MFSPSDAPRSAEAVGSGAGTAGGRLEWWGRCVDTGFSVLGVGRPREEAADALRCLTQAGSPGAGGCVGMMPGHGSRDTVDARAL